MTEKSRRSILKSLGIASGIATSTLTSSASPDKSRRGSAPIHPKDNLILKNAGKSGHRITLQVESTKGTNSISKTLNIPPLNHPNNRPKRMPDGTVDFSEVPTPISGLRINLPPGRQTLVAFDEEGNAAERTITVPDGGLYSYEKLVVSKRPNGRVILDKICE